ncbi:mitochondrial ATPase complex subunit ATP10 [Acrasis kona]|uniref:Mitochondrial ATPase complex subunit ATP10 n=1 Tax=Acrasis kona TaxID=1008807 RepID=A0AAW2Z052_9EUKA
MLLRRVSAISCGRCYGILHDLGLFRKETRIVPPSSSDEEGETFVDYREKFNQTDFTQDKRQVENVTLSPNIEGKLFTALPVVIPASDSLQFPHFGDSRTLRGVNVNIPQYVTQNRIKATLVILRYSAIGAPHADKWTEIFLKKFPTATGIIKSDGTSNGTDSDEEMNFPPGQKGVQILDVHAVEQLSIHVVRAIIDRFIRRNTPEHRRSHTVTTYKPNSVIGNYKQVLNISDLQTCYVFLLDKKARVRWRAVGYPTETEGEMLLQLASKMISSS